MSSSEFDSDSSIDHNVKSLIRRPRDDSEKSKINANDSLAAVTVKKRRPAGKVGKPSAVLRNSRPNSQNEPRRGQVRSSNINDQTRGSNSFYQGALLGSFLGATLTTVVTNLVARTFQNG